jgi:hypothetical protein
MFGNLAGVAYTRHGYFLRGTWAGRIIGTQQHGSGGERKGTGKEQSENRGRKTHSGLLEKSLGEKKNKEKERGTVGNREQHHKI